MSGDDAGTAGTGVTAVDPDRVEHARARVPDAEELARLTDLLSLMSDPTRLRVLYALDTTEEVCVGDLAIALSITEDQVGYALRMLRAAGLVRARKQGRTVYNRLAPDFPESLRAHCLHQLVRLSQTSDD